MSTVIIILIAALIALTSLWITHGQDNPVEDAAEAVMDKELGLAPGTINLIPKQVDTRKP